MKGAALFRGESLGQARQHAGYGYPAREGTMIEQPIYLECPCCGDDGAVSDSEGYFTDGQALICGCPGWVSVDSDLDGFSEVCINNGDAPCLKCEQAEQS